MKKFIILSLVLWIGAVSRPNLSAQNHPLSPAISAADVHSIISQLASDQWAGRKPGTAGGDSAAAYIRDYFQSLGLKMLCDNGYQPFSLITEATAGPGNAIAINGTPSPAAPVPYSFSTSATVGAATTWTGARRARPTTSSTS